MFVTIAFVRGCSGDKAHQFSGVAAFYDRHYGERRALQSKPVAAHRTLPFGTRLHVTDRRTRRSVEVVITDRGPFNRGRVLDLSLAAAKQLRIVDRGLARVMASVAGR